MKIPPIQIDGYRRLTENDDIPFSPIPPGRLREWAQRNVRMLIEEYDGTYAVRTCTSGDGMVVATISAAFGIVDVYYCRIEDSHMYYPNR